MKIILALLLILCGLTGYAESEYEHMSKADSIIRKVINKNQAHKNLVLKANSYLKHSLVLNKAPKRFLGKRVRKLLKLNSTDEQILYLYESNSDLYFSKSGKIKEEVKAFKDFGNYRNWEFTRATDLQINFNKDYVILEAISDKKFVSPIGKDAFKFYNFEIIERILDGQGTPLDMIKINPKKDFSPTFTGYIYVNANTSQVSKLSLSLGNNASISFINDLTINQDLIKIDSVYYPTKTTVTYFGRGLGFAYSGTCTGNFTYTKDLSKTSKFKNHEILRIQNQTEESEAGIAKSRPIPLTTLERKTFSRDDSLKAIQGEKKYLDSLDRLSLKQRLYPFLFGSFKFQNSYREYIIELDAIAPAIFYNTVEGPGIKYGASFTKYEKDGGYYQIRPEFRYGFKNKEFNSDASFSWLYNAKKRAIVDFSIGSTYRDLNPNGTLNSLNNSLNTLLFEQNFMKLFRKQYVSISSGREITNGLFFSGGLELSKNISVSNTFDYSLRNIRNKNFTSNNPLLPDVESKLFPDHTTLRLSGTLIYTFNHNYITNQGIKMYEIPKNPRIILSFRKGIPNVLGSETDYNFLELELQQEKLEMGLWGYASFSFSAGKFFSNSKNYYPDWKHFSGNMALVFNPGLKSFHFLDFYAYSTDKKFIEAHWEHNFNCRFLGRIPLMRKLKLQELIGSAVLAQPDRSPYYEAYIGLKRLTFRADYAVAFNNNRKLNQGFKFSLRF
jgi:hypothetical protein